MQKTDTLGLMEKAPLFHGVSRDKLQYLAERARHRVFKAGKMIIGETDAIRAFYVVLTGKAKLYKSSSAGKEQTLYLLGPGEPFGLCTAFAIESFPVNVSALEESTVLIIPGPDVETVASQEPALLLNVIRVLSNRLKESMTLVESLALQEVPQRLAAFLLDSLRRSGEPEAHRVELSTTHRELAKILGATPEALSRTLKKMAGEGILTANGRIITIPDRQALEDMVERE